MEGGAPERGSSARAVVIGGGISGLTAAYNLRKRGVHVTICEPGHTGGVMKSLSIDGFTLECGPNVLLAKPEILALIREIGLEDQMVFPRISRYRQYVWFRGRPTLVPKGPGAFLTTPFFSPAAKMRTLSRMVRRGVLTPHSDEESVATFIERLVGPEAIDSLVDPVLKGIFGGDVRRLGAPYIFPKLWEAARGGSSLVEYLRAKGGAPPRTFVLRGGLETLATRLIERLGSDLSLVRERVESVAARGRGSFEVRTGGGQSLRCDRLVVASPLRTGAFLQELAPDLVAAASRVRYASLAMAQCAVKKPCEGFLPEDAFGVLFPKGIDEGLLGVMFNSTIFPHMAPEGMHMVTVSLGGIGAEAVLELPDALLYERIARLLDQRLGIRSERVLAISRWRDAIPQYECGHGALLAEIDRTERAHPGLSFVTVERGGVGVPDRVRNALITTEK